MLGERLGKWVIYKQLGRGGMGRVYLAQEELTGRQAAVKVLAAELAQDVGFLQRFQREIATLGTLDHPNIVHFYESGYENGLYFYAMEYVEGQNLEQVLEEHGRLPWKEVLEIGLQICPAIKHAHDHGIIHRDLKPPNILRTSAGVIKLSDFGIAKVFAGDHLTATGGVVGTAEYLSPEQAAGKPVTRRSDLYSLGIVFYTLLTGRTPFEGTTFLDLLHKHRYAQFDAPQKIVPDIPYELDEIVCQLMAKDPADRPADGMVLGRKLEVLRNKLERKSNLTGEGVPAEETVAENRVGAFDPDKRPGPATLMSRLMRDELDRQNRGSTLSRLLNRPIVLVPLFLLCVAAIVWTFWPPSAEALFERGAAAMGRSERLRDWEEAWKEYFEPLNSKYPDHPYQEEVKKYEAQLEAARRRQEVVSEAQRFYRQGERLRQEGNTGAARQVWEDVVGVFQGVLSEAEWVRRAEDGLAELKKADDGQRWEPVWAALEHAAQLQKQDRRGEAERVWRGLEELYRADPSARAILARVEAERKKFGGP